jgi:hypothetical protein
MTQAEWEKFMFGNGPVATNQFLIDKRLYSPDSGPAPISAYEIRKIRARASWSTLFPYRTVAVELWSPTNASLVTFERHTSELKFTKDAAGWHMERIGGQICWQSEDDEPKVSFH